MVNQYCIHVLTNTFQTLGSRVLWTETKGIALIQAINALDHVLNVERHAIHHSNQFVLAIKANESIADFKNTLGEVSDHFQVDLIIKPWAERKIKPGLLIMDMDSTLVQAETIDEIARVAGVGDKVAKITESAMRGELDFTESLKARVSMLAGISLASIDSVHQCLPLTDGAMNLLSKARLNGCHTALVSGGFTLFAAPIANKLRFDTLSANELEIRDGKLTGAVIGHIVDGNSKLSTMKRLQHELGLKREQIVAIGDGANDLPMLTAAGTGIAFHAKPAVQEQASARLNYNNLNALCWLMNWH